MMREAATAAFCICCWKFAAELIFPSDSKFLELPSSFPGARPVVSRGETG